MTVENNSSFSDFYSSNHENQYIIKIIIIQPQLFVIHKPHRVMQQENKNNIRKRKTLAVVAVETVLLLDLTSSTHWRGTSGLIQLRLSHMC